MSSEITKQKCSRTLNKFSSFFLVFALFVSPIFAAVLFPSSSFAQAFPSRGDQINAVLDQMEQHLSATVAASSAMNRGEYPDAARQFNGRRQQEMETTLHKVTVELELDYFLSNGQQKFEAIQDDGTLLSRLKYKNSGPIPMVRGEIKYDRFSIGGRYAGGLLEKNENTDEDWNIIMDISGTDTAVDYTISRQYCKPRIEFYDANLYYNLLTKVPVGEQARKVVLIDDYSLDIFGGYQYYRGRYPMLDPEISRYLIISGTEYEELGLPADVGLNSPYKVIYQGPRAGVRFTGTRGHWSTSVSAAYAYLQTKAHGYWNLRDYVFDQRAEGYGYGTEIGIETTYAFTPSWSLGIGYDYNYFYQKKLTASGDIRQGVSKFSDIDYIRNVENTTAGLTLILKYIW
jgi:hypothetical protein